MDADGLQAVDAAEIYSPPRIVPAAERRGLEVGDKTSSDLADEWVFV